MRRAGAAPLPRAAPLLAALSSARRVSPPRVLPHCGADALVARPQLVNELP
jgi:hypothetical protein